MRITKVTTKQGDKGKTTLGNGTVVSKSHLRIECLGDLDELNATIGFASIVLKVDSFSEELESIQNDLFNLGGEISIPDFDKVLFNDERITFLENHLDQMNQSLPPLKEFILPGGDEFSTRIHLARAVCRRTERRVVNLVEAENGELRWIQYLNRLSDYLFVLARFHNYSTHKNERQWDRNKE